MLVVVLIIGILAAVAVPQYQKAVEKSRVAEVVLMFNNFRKAQSLCRLEHPDWSCLYFDELNDVMDLPDYGVDCEGYSKCFDTKNWRYGEDDTLYADRIINNISPYYLMLVREDDNTLTGQIVCYSYSNKDECKNVCGANGCTVQEAQP